jgi:hypothetical protein
MKNLKYLVIVLNFLFQSTAHAEINMEKLAPGVSTTVDINDKNFSFEVALGVPNNPDITLYKDQVVTGNIISQVSTWVKEATFTKMTPGSTEATEAEATLRTKWENDNLSKNDPKFKIDLSNILPKADIYNFTLSINHLFAGTFVHRFICRDIELSPSKWRQVCEQGPALKDDAPVLHNTKIDILCLNPNATVTDGSATTGTKENSRCYFNMVGQVSDLKVGFKTVSSYLIISTFITEYVKFVTHLALIVNDNANNVKEAKALYKKSTYRKMIEDLDTYFHVFSNATQRPVIFDAVLEVSGISEMLNKKQSHVVFNSKN